MRQARTGGAKAMGITIVGLFAIFAATFTALSVKFLALRYLRYFGAAFLACGLAILMQTSWWPPTQVQANPLISTALYLIGAHLFAEGLLRRSQSSMGWTFHVPVYVLLIGLTAYFTFVAPSLVARAYVINFAFGAILLCALWRTRTLASGTLADRLVFWTFLAIGLHFFPRTLLTVGSLRPPQVEYSTTLFWQVFQHTSTLAATLGAISVLVTSGIDVFIAMRNERDTDLLTGILNRRGIESAIHALPLSNRTANAAVVIADIDDFKAINDTLGHAAGDTVLRAVAARLTSYMRKGDLIARIGGEEFVFFIAGSVAEAANFAERIRLAIEKEPITADGTPLKMTVSFGIAQYIAGENLWDAIKKADTALYLAKRAGKNTIRVEDNTPRDMALVS